jgi:hypothetical protein
LTARPDPEIPAGALIVCLPASDPAKFTDDVFATCETCGTSVRHRPSIPANTLKICLPCFRTARGAERRGRPLTAVITSATRSELALYLSEGKRQ